MRWTGVFWGLEWKFPVMHSRIPLSVSYERGTQYSNWICSRRTHKNLQPHRFNLLLAEDVQGYQAVCFHLWYLSKIQTKAPHSLWIIATHSYSDSTLWGSVHGFYSGTPLVGWIQQYFCNSGQTHEVRNIYPYHYYYWWKGNSGCSSTISFQNSEYLGKLFRIETLGGKEISGKKYATKWEWLGH